MLLRVETTVILYCEILIDTVGLECGRRVTIYGVRETQGEGARDREREREREQLLLNVKREVAVGNSSKNWKTRKGV